MKRASSIFGTWAVFNVAACACLHVWELVWGHWPDCGDFSKMVIAVAVVSVMIPFIRTATLPSVRALNWKRRASREDRQLFFQRWKQVYFRGPLATSALLLCIVQFLVLLLANGAFPSARLTGKTHLNRLLITAAAIAFSAASAHANLLVERKCGDFLSPRSIAKSEKRAQSKRRYSRNADQ